MADLNFINADNCSKITFTTPTTGLQYVEYITGSVIKDFTDVDKYTITHSATSCLPETVTNVAPRYQFVFSIVSCVVLPVTFVSLYTVKIDNINGNLVQSIEGSTGGFPFVPVAFEVIADELFIDFGNAGVFALVILLKITTLSGFVYYIELTNDQTADCVATITDVTITYPPLPANVVYTNAEAFATTGPLAPAIGEGFTITADNLGVIGNVNIIGDGIETINGLISNYNIANPTNTVTLTITVGIGAYIPFNGETFSLIGGIDTPLVDELSLNSLIGKTIVPSGIYELNFCEVLQDGTSICIENSENISCSKDSCSPVDICDSTTEPCNITSAVMAKHQSIIYGLQCCKQANLNIIKHHIRLTCPDVLKCS